MKLTMHATGALFLVLCAGLGNAGTQYNMLEDAAVAQAKVWQSGGKAKAIISSDGMVRFPFGQAMPKLTCSPTRACDIEMQPGEKVKKVILGDGQNWTWDGAESVERGVAVQHVVFQPKDNDLESNVIITTDRRTYHIKLYAPKQEGVYLNRVGFYYPQDLVSSWEDRMGTAAKAEAKEEGFNILTTAVPLEKLDYGYRIEGDADFKPVRVLNDGERVYLEMPDSVRNGENPTLHLLDDKDRAMVVNYRRHEDPNTGKVHYIVDKLFAKAELVSGSEKVRIIWKKKDKGTWGGLFGSGG
ncbi:hypothetical protein RHDC4_00031 [Rhodocyclaceae bacterium]|nr:hypothetical protein RHDC4_00031 [Rhodocyclaceae bacterium]